MNETQANRMIKYFLDNGLIVEDDSGRYNMTKNGEYLLEILRKRHLVGMLTQELSGDRIKRW